MVTATFLLRWGLTAWTGFCLLLPINRRSYFLGDFGGCLPLGRHVDAGDVSVRICELGIKVDAGGTSTVGTDDVDIRFWVLLASRPASPNSASVRIGSFGPWC